jgi:ATP-dependent Clp protease ATP-binding subunit ClpC
MLVQENYKTLELVLDLVLRQKNEQADDAAKGVIESALKKAFAPEFLNRVDDVIVFNSLKKEDIHKIIDIELVKLYSRINELEYKLTLSDKAKDFIADKGFDKKYGARPLNRAIQKYIEDILAEQIVSGNVNPGDEVKMDLNEKGDELITTVKKKKTKPTEK